MINPSRSRGRGEASLRPYENHRGGIFLVIVNFIVIAFTTSQTIVPSSAQSGGGYDLTWNSIDGGGATFSTGGTYSLGGTIGQPDAGTLSGGAFTLRGGFWGIADLFRLFLPLIEK